MRTFDFDYIARLTIRVTSDSVYEASKIANGLAFSTGLGDANMSASAVEQEPYCVDELRNEKWVKIDLEEAILEEEGHDDK